MLLSEFWERVTLLCLEFDASVTSGVRSRLRNTIVGGAEGSWHMYGMAADCVLDDPSRTDAFVARARKLFEYVLPEGDHVHVQGEK